MGTVNAACNAEVSNGNLVIRRIDNTSSIAISKLSLGCNPGNWSQGLGGLIVLQSGKINGRSVTAGTVYVVAASSLEGYRS